MPLPIIDRLSTRIEPRNPGGRHARFHFRCHEHAELSVAPKLIERTNSSRPNSTARGGPPLLSSGDGPSPQRRPSPATRGLRGAAARGGYTTSTRAPTCSRSARSRFAACSDEMLVRRGKEVSTLVACGAEAPHGAAVRGADRRRGSQRQVGMGPASATTTSSPMRSEGERQAAPLRVMPGQGTSGRVEWSRVGSGRTFSGSAGLTR
jgi:hypothetical protein